MNKQVNVSQSYLREVRQLLYVWKKHGENVAAEKFWAKRQIATDDSKKPALRNVLEGKLLYMKMVRGEDDVLYQRYSQAFVELVGRETGTWTEFPIKQRVAKLTEIIELYKKGDIAQATELMEFYKKTRQINDERRAEVDTGFATGDGVIGESSGPVGRGAPIESAVF